MKSNSTSPVRADRCAPPGPRPWKPSRARSLSIGSVYRSRDAKLPPEALDRAARRLETLFGDEVLPLEDHISRSVRRHVPDLLEKLGSLPDRLRLLSLPGESRSQRLLADAADLLKGDAGGAALGPRWCRMRAAGRNHLGQGRLRRLGVRRGGRRPERPVGTGFDCGFGPVVPRFRERLVEP